MDNDILQLVNDWAKKCNTSFEIALAIYNKANSNMILMKKILNDSTPGEQFEIIKNVYPDSAADGKILVWGYDKEEADENRE